MTFAPQPAPPLPPGMTGSDTNDPRYTLKPGLYDAGEAAFGMKHVAFVKKPDVFQLHGHLPRRSGGAEDAGPDGVCMSPRR